MKYNSDEYVGLRSGYLTVVGYKSQRFLCKCACGRYIEEKPWFIVNSRRKSCGDPMCEYAKQVKSDASTTHGLTGTRLYNIWDGMIGRCYRENNPTYKYYGAKGVKVCEEWRNDARAFVEWARTHDYRDDLTLDRIDPFGDYTPENCRWADYSTQNKNKREKHAPPVKPRTIIWTINGVRKSCKEWCEDYGVEYDTVLYRVKKMGLAPEEALSMRKLQNGRPRKETK